MKKKKKQQNLIIRITDIEKNMIKEIKEKHSVNISALVRKLIQDYYEKIT